MTAAKLSLLSAVLLRKGKKANAAAATKIRAGRRKAELRRRGM